VTVAIPTRPAEGLPLDFPAEPAVARPSGALWAPAQGALVVADLHLGKTERMARRGGALLPPYEVVETLARLEAEVAALSPAVVACLGDSFDDDAAAEALEDAARARLAGLAAGRRWVWIAGNHDPAPRGLPGETAAELRLGGLHLRHIARAGPAAGEVSGHLHPKAALRLRGRRIARRCFVADRARIVLPAFGAYAGGLDACDAAFDALFPGPALALLLGPRLVAAPRSALSPRGA
jgi:DNA ligase-associated metallophosphoesterase